MPVSSSIVMNITPLAEPGLWRTSTRPATVDAAGRRGTLASSAQVTMPRAAQILAQEGERDARAASGPER